MRNMEVEAVTPHGIDDKPFDPFPRGPVQSISSLLETSSSPQEDGTTISSTDLDTVALDVVVPSVELDQPAEGRDELDAKSDGTEEGLASPTLSDLEARVESLEEELARAKSNLESVSCGYFLIVMLEDQADRSSVRSLLRLNLLTSMMSKRPAQEATCLSTNPRPIPLSIV